MPGPWRGLPLQRRSRSAENIQPVAPTGVRLARAPDLWGVRGLLRVHDLRVGPPLRQRESSRLDEPGHRHGLDCVGGGRSGRGRRAPRARRPAVGDRWRRPCRRPGLTQYSPTCAAATPTASTSNVTANASRSTCCYPWSEAGISGPSSRSAAWRSSSAERPWVSASAGRPGPLRQRTPDVGRVHGAARGAGSSAGFLVGWERSAHLALAPVVPVLCPDDLSLLQPLSDVATSGSALAFHPMGALRAVRAGVRARLGADFHGLSRRL